MGNRSISAFGFLLLFAAVCCLCTESAAAHVSKSNCRLQERKICATSSANLTCCRKDPAHNSSHRNYICPQLSSDASHCGSCTKACSHGKICQDGKCVSNSPPPVIAPCRKLCIQGLSCCNDTCVDLQSDNGNCGSCTEACFHGKICQAGKCVSNSPPPVTAPCRKLCIQGLSCCNDTCVDLQSDNDNCGACGISCRPPPGFAGFLFCFKGKCVP